MELLTLPHGHQLRLDLLERYGTGPQRWGWHGGGHGTLRGCWALRGQRRERAELHAEPLAPRQVPHHVHHDRRGHPGLHGQHGGAGGPAAQNHPAGGRAEEHHGQHVQLRRRDERPGNDTGTGTPPLSSPHASPPVAQPLGTTGTTPQQRQRGGSREGTEPPPPSRQPSPAGMRLFFSVVGLFCFCAGLCS